jgi:P27 family predicted phage terminase small subunit
MRGRKPKPNDIKAVAGNPGRRQLSDDEPVYIVPERVPYAPRNLTDEARQEWRRVAALLMRARVLTEADLTALTLYCDAYGRWIEARRKVTEAGPVLKSAATGALYDNPYVYHANRAHEQMLKLMVEFGMTPSSRTRVHAIAPERDRSLAELLFESATGQDVTVGNEAEGDATD